MSTRPDSFRHLAPDGTPILTHHWRTPSPARGAVVIAHGMGEHALRYDHVAQRLTQAGYAVYANDHRGHGRQAKASNTLGDFGSGGFRGVVADLDQTLQRTRHEHPGLPVALLGHSMGSFAAQLLLVESQEPQHLPDAVALSGSAALDLLIQAQKRGEGMAQPNARIDNPRTPFDWLSRDPDVVDAYIADPLCAFALTRESSRSLGECAYDMANPEKLARIPKDLPLYLFTGDQDPVNGYLAFFGALVSRYQNAGLKKVQSRVYPDARHETLNELQRDQVMDDLVVWLNAALRAEG